MDFKKTHFSTRAIHAGFHHDNNNGAVMPPIQLSTTFAQVAPGKPIDHFEYTRTLNPTREVLEKTLAMLEQGHYGLCFSSGCAAMATVLQSLPNGSHALVSDDIYGGSLRLLNNVYSEQGLTYTLADFTQLDTISSLLQSNTQLVWLETPSNPLLKIIDIASLSKIVKSHSPNALVAVDNTFATPYLQTPLTLGADIVCHSTTKYIGGHSDVLGGALIVNNEDYFKKLQFLQNAMGAVPSPFDCYLLLRSLKTLAVRMNAHCSNAQKIAEFLEKHPKIEKVIYPGLSSHPQHSLAKSQMQNFGGMISVVLKTDEKNTIAFLQNLHIFTLAESLGGVESLIEHPTSMTHAAIPIEHRQAIGIKDSLVRLSIGIEDVRDLIEDITQGLQNI